MGGVNAPSEEPFQPHYEPSFMDCRRTLGLSGPDFDHHFEAVEKGLCRFPWLENESVPEGDGIRIRPTRERAPDLPPLYVYYRIELNPRRVVFFGLSRAWSQPGEPTPLL